MILKIRHLSRFRSDAIGMNMSHDKITYLLPHFHNFSSALHLWKAHCRSAPSGLSGGRLLFHPGHIANSADPTAVTERPAWNTAREDPVAAIACDRAVTIPTLSPPPSHRTWCPLRQRALRPFSSAGKGSSFIHGHVSAAADDAEV